MPQYRFHYYVKDDKTGDYKVQEEHRTGDSVTGSYMVGEPNGDLRVVTYIADVKNGFKADVSVQPGASPIKTLGTTTQEAIAGFNNYRTGISAPPRNRKPARGFSPIVVNPKSIPLPVQTESSPFLTAVTHPYPYYKDTQNISASYFTTPVTKKSVQVDLTFNDEAVIEKRAEVTVMQQKKAEPSSTEVSPSSTSQPSQNGLYQLGNMDIPSSVMEILSQHKVKAEGHPALSDAVATSTIAAGTVVTKPSVSNEENGSSKVDLIQSNDNAVLNDSTSASLVKKVNLPQRPMRLIGLSPIYMEISQLQTITENLTSIPQMHLEPFPNIQYATPAPFHSGPLPNGPAGPFRNLPRSVSESSSPEYSILNSMPVFSSIPISAPIVSQPITETKEDNNKTPSPTLSLCNDCLIPASFMPYPVVRMPFPPPATNNQQQKTNCPPNNPTHLGPYTPSLAYILMPTSVLKNKLNDTRPITSSIWKK